MAKSNGKSTDGFAGFAGFSGFDAEAISSGFEKMFATAGEFGELNRAGFEALNASAKVSADGLKELTERSTTYWKESMEAGMEATKSMSSAKSFQEVIEFQAEFARVSMEKFMTEAGEVASLMASTMRESVEPINSHAGFVVEKMQAAAK